MHLLADEKRRKRLIPKMVRLSSDHVDRIKRLAEEQSTQDVKVTESDIVRHALALFFASNDNQKLT